MSNPNSLVEGWARRYGRLEARPSVVNPLDEFTGLTRRLRGLRLKEWIGFTLLHPDWYSSLILQDAHYLASSEIYAYDRAAHVLHQHAATLRSSSLSMPAALLGSTYTVRRGGYAIAYAFAEADGEHRLTFDVAATPTAPAIAGELRLDAAHAGPPLSVSSRLPGRRARMYTHKALFPVGGVLRVGDKKILFDPERDLAILDEHRSLLPYRTNWLWGTFALPTPDGPVGANFVDRPEVPGEPEESCVWTPRACEPLADITFAPADPADPNAPWHITSADGRLEVTFTPEGRKQVKHQLGIFAIDYFQLFGRYTGTLRGGDTTHQITAVHGVCESMRARL